MLLLIKIIGRLPLSLLYFFGDILSFPLSFIYRRKMVSRNLKKAFPDMSQSKLKQVRARYYKNLVSVIMEVIKSPYMTEVEIKRRVKCINPEVVETERALNRSILLFGAHYCNWELVGLAVKLHTGFRLDSIYKIQKNKALDRFIYGVRSRVGNVPIPAKTALRNVLRNKEEFRMVGIVGDQKPVYRASKIWVNFLGIETAFAVGGASMAYMTQFPCYYMKVDRISRGYYEMEFVKIAEPRYEKNDQSMLVEYAREMEKQLVSCPEDWLWTHDRWKYVRREEEVLTE